MQKNVGWYKPSTAELKFFSTASGWQEPTGNYTLQSAEYDYEDDLKDGCISGDSTILDPGEDKYAYGVLIDWTNSSSCDLLRIGNPDLHRTLPVQSQYKGVIWDHVDKKIYTYLNPDDWTKSNGAFTDEQINTLLQGLDPFYDEESGTGSPYFKYSIRVNTPKFYVCAKILETNHQGDTMRAKIMFSTKKVNSNYKLIPEMVTSFRNDRSISNKTGKTGLSGYRSTIGTYAFDKNEYMYGGDGEASLTPRMGTTYSNLRPYMNGANSHVFSYEAWKWIVYWAIVIEYASLDVQKPFKGNWKWDDDTEVRIENPLDKDGYHYGGLGIGIANLGNNGYSYHQRITRGKTYQELEKRYDLESQSGVYWDISYPSETEYRTLNKNTEKAIGVTNVFGNHSGEILKKNSTLLHGGDSTHPPILSINRYRGFELPNGDIPMLLGNSMIFPDSKYGRKIYHFGDIGTDEYNYPSSYLGSGGDNDYTKFYHYIDEKVSGLAYWDSEYIFGGDDESEPYYVKFCSYKNGDLIPTRYCDWLSAPEYANIAVDSQGSLGMGVYNPISPSPSSFNLMTGGWYKGEIGSYQSSYMFFSSNSPSYGIKTYNWRYDDGDWE